MLVSARLMSLAFATEKQFAVAAVRRACRLTNSVFNKLVRNETLTKDDKSPVTVGDYAAQAVIGMMLSNAFPSDPIVGEEDSSDLRNEANVGLKDRIVQLANEALCEDLQLGDVEGWGIGPGKERSADEMLAAIDRGSYEGGNSSRMWTIDPIDGTKGFLRGGQYAVCLALVIDAKVQVGVIGCPNLPVDWNKPEGDKGTIFIAVRGQGTEQLSVNGANPTKIKIPSTSPSNLNFLESVEAAHSDHDFNSRVSSVLGITREPTRMDSQAKYGCLARGDGGAYLRMPTKAGYKEKIWDHASGSLLVEEAGGVVSDSRGQPLNFGLGRTLGENYGVVASGKDIHGKVIEAIAKVYSEEGKAKS